MPVAAYLRRCLFRLFTYVNEQQVFGKPTYISFLSLLDNYNVNIGQTESLTEAELAEIDAFLDAILATQVMSLAFNFLRENGKWKNTF